MMSDKAEVDLMLRDIRTLANATVVGGGNHPDLHKTIEQFDQYIEALSQTEPSEGVEEIVSFIRAEAKLGAKYANDSKKGSTRRASFGGASLALDRIATLIEGGQYHVEDDPDARTGCADDDLLGNPEQWLSALRTPDSDLLRDVVDRAGEFIAVCKPMIYSKPDKPESDYGRMVALEEALSRLSPQKGGA